MACTRAPHFLPVTLLITLVLQIFVSQPLVSIITVILYIIIIIIIILIWGV